MGRDKRAGVSAIAALAASVAIFCCPAVAAAGDSTTMHFSLPASQGYTMQIKTEGDLAEVSLRKSDGDDVRVGATYYVDEAVSPGAIDADLGPLGAIHVRFVPSGQTRVLHVERGRVLPGCRAPHNLRRALGSFEGTIAFRGENGFAAADAIRARGSVGPSAQLRCEGSTTLRRRVGAPRLPRVEHVWVKSRASLFARDPSSRGDTSMTWFLASTTRFGVRYTVNRFEILPSGLVVSRSATVAGPSTGFAYNGRPTAATLTPPAPFSGEATYSQRRHRLSGDLAVELPGLEPEPLTGPRFEALISTPR